MRNPFLRNTSDYIRDIDVMRSYKLQMSIGIAKRFSISIEEATAYIDRVTAKEGRLAIRDPALKFVGRKENGDREYQVTTFTNYLKIIQDRHYIVAPSMTVYENPKRLRSRSAKYIAKNVVKRNKSKYEMFIASENNDVEMELFKDNEQRNSKIKNNALSGAHVSASTPLHMPTVHSSLTTMCRTSTGLGNANNEKVLCGNRHYWCIEVIYANITACLQLVDMQVFDAMMKRHNLHYCTTDEVMEMIEYSSKLYQNNVKRMESLREFIDCLSPVERSAFMYTGDLYHIAKYNRDMMHTLLTRLSNYSVDPTLTDIPQLVKDASEESLTLTALLCGKYMEGRSFKQFDIFSDDVKLHLGSCLKNIITIVSEDYEDFIIAILASDFIPASVAKLPSIIRRGAITSDTDSTIYTVQDWLMWYGGEISFKDELVNVGHAISFLSSSMITHILAIMSKNVGVRDSQLHQYAMKPEYYFPVFGLTSRAKTYFALQGAKEGQVFKETKLESKGAVLKASNSPEFIREGVKELIVSILNKVHSGEELSILDVLNHVADIEDEIMAALKRGDVGYFKQVEIKSSDSYKKPPHQSPYQHHTFWNEVFGDKYGLATDPPYAAIKVNIQADNKTEFNEWLTSIEDPAIRLKIKEYMLKYKKDIIKMLYIPYDSVITRGVPDELISGTAGRRIISNLMEPYYVVLESLGYYTIDNKQLRLISDNYGVNGRNVVLESTMQ